LIGVVKPSTLVVANVIVADALPHATETGAGVMKVNVGTVAAVILKLAFDISKKIFPTASIFILAVVVVTLGIVTNSEPSLGVLAVITVGYVNPPSVESEILTLVALIGAALVPATSQVIVCVELPW